MNLEEFLLLLGRAYDFPDYYGVNLDAADEILGERLEASEQSRFSLEPLFRALLSEASSKEQEVTWAFIRDYFAVPESGDPETSEDELL